MLVTSSQIFLIQKRGILMKSKEYFEVGYLDTTGQNGITVFSEPQFRAIQNRDVNLAMSLGVPLDRYLQFLTVIY